MQETKKPAYEGWAILELMGHRRLAGKVSEAVIAGTPLLRVDVPLKVPEGTPEAFATQFYGSPAIYCLTPTSEQLARAVATVDQPAPVTIWELPELRRSLPPSPPREPSFGSPAWELQREKERRAEELERVEMEASAQDAEPPIEVVVDPELVRRIVGPAPEVVTPSPVSPPPSDDIPF